MSPALGRILSPNTWVSCKAVRLAVGRASPQSRFFPPGPKFADRLEVLFGLPSAPYPSKHLSHSAPPWLWVIPPSCPCLPGCLPQELGVPQNLLLLPALLGKLLMHILEVQGH